jgi:hypothetical protein
VRASARRLRIRLAIEASKNSRASAASPAKARRASLGSIACCTSSKREAGAVLLEQIVDLWRNLRSGAATRSM